MNKTNLRLAAFVAVLASLASCQSNELVLNETSGRGLVFSASYDSNDPATRTQMDSAEKHILWSAGDKISIFDSDEIGYEFTASGAGSSVSFTLTDADSPSETELWYALYPYDEDADLSDGVFTTTLKNEFTETRTGSFNDNMNIAVAKSSTMSLSFKNVLGWLRVASAGLADDVVKIEFRGNDDEYLAGQIEIDYTGETPVATLVANKTKVMTINVENYVHSVNQPKEERVFFYIPVLPQTFAHGFNLKFYNSQGISGSFNYDKSVTFKRGQRNAMFAGITPPDNEIWYSTEDGEAVVYTVPTDSDNVLDEVIAPNDNGGVGVIRFQSPITTVDPEALFFKRNLISVTLPNSVETIGACAFASCVNLTQVSFGTNLKTIGVRSFEYCALTDLELPDGLLSIKAEAFKANYALQSVTLPQSVISLGAVPDPLDQTYHHSLPDNVFSNPFCGCGNLASFSGKFASSDGRALVVTTNGKKQLVSFASSGLEGESYVVPPVDIIAVQAFQGASVGEAVLPEGLTSIYDRAFQDCAWMTSVTIPSTVNLVGAFAFNRCGNSVGYLESVTINSTSVPEVSNIYGGYDYNTGRMFDQTGDCPIYVPSNLLAQYKTERFWSLYESRYTAVQSDYEIWYTTTDGQPVAHYFSSSDLDGTPVAPNNNGGVGIIRFKTPLTEIAVTAFRDAVNLKTISLPKTVEIIGLSAFKGCSNLEDFCFDNIKTIASQAFYGTGLTELVLPEGVGYLGQNAFSNCASLESVTLPESVTFYVVSSAYFFVDCPNLREFNGHYASDDHRCLILNNQIVAFATGGLGSEDTYIIPDGVIGVQSYSFQGASVGRVTLPEGITLLGTNAFANSALKDVTIPPTVYRIGQGAFQGCSALQWVKIQGSDSVIDNRGPYVLDNTNNCPIYVPANLLNDYKTATNWSEYAVRFRAAQSNSAIWYTTTDGEAASYTLPDAYQSYASQIQNIAPNNNSGDPGTGYLTFPFELTEIPLGLFDDCDNLKTVMIPDGVTTIESFAFRGCDNLDDVLFGNSVERIESWAFSECNLSAVNLPNTLKYLGDSCFGDNPLTTVRIPSSVNSVSLNPFENCENLASFTGDNPIVADEGRCLIIPGDNELMSFASASVTSPLHYAIPDGVKKIHDAAFRKAQFQSVSIPASVETIGGWNFLYCPNLTTVRIIGGDNLTIGTCVLRNCPLQRIIINSATPPTIQEDTFFYIPSSGTPQLKIPESCQIAIPGSGYSNYNSLEFYPRWYALRDHFLYYQADNEIWYHYKNNQVSATLDVSADYGAPRLNQFVFLCERSQIGSNVTIPSSIAPSDGTFAIAVASFDGNVTKIPDDVFSSTRFSGQRELDWVSLPTRIVSIGDRAFKGSSSLTVLPFSNLYYLLTIGNEAFLDCSIMSSPTASINIILQSVTTIGESAFQGCSAIKRITAPRTASVGKYAFKGCSQLQIVDIRGALTEIADHTFEDCSNLEAVLLPNPGSITTVGEYAFYQDRKLKTVGPDNGVAEVYLPGVTELKKEAFFSCSEFERVRMPELLTIGENVFNSNGYLSAPISFSLPKLRTIQGWYSFGHLIADELYLPSLKDAGSASFIFGYSQIKNLRFGPSLESLPYLNNTNDGYCFNDSTSSMERNLYFEGSTPPRFGPRTFVTDYNYSGPSSVLLNLNSIHVPAGCKEAYKTALHNANSLYDGFFSIIVDDL